MRVGRRARCQRSNVVAVHVIELRQLFLRGQVQHADGSIVTAGEDEGLVSGEASAMHRRSEMLFEMTELRACLEVEDTNDAIFRARTDQTTV